MNTQRHAATLTILIHCTSAFAAGEAESSWRQDKPGHVHHIDIANLPRVFATQSAGNSSRVVPRPKDAKLSLPPGFKAEVFASKLKNPRRMRIAPNGDIFSPNRKRAGSW